MGSKTSKAKCPTPMKAKTIVVPRIPQEIIDEVLNYLTTEPGLKSLQSCALVSKSWVRPCRRYIFHTILFTLWSMTRWLETFPVPEESPAYHVKDLRFLFGWSIDAPRGFSEHTPWFTNVEKMTLSGHTDVLLSWIPSLGKLPRSVTSLAINVPMVSLARVRDVLVQLPNLDSLSLSGSLITEAGDALPGMGTTLRGRFGGRLRLVNGYADKDVMNMLLEVPTGLHFAEVHIRGTHESFPSTVRLAEACGKTLIKLSYVSSIRDPREAFERSFNFSEFPNLQEVVFEVDWMTGDLLWIPTALSTLKHTTSPRLSALQLSFVMSTTTHSVKTSIEDMGNDLRCAADEVARIEHEFEGGVELTLARDPGFEAVFDALNILQHLDR